MPPTREALRILEERDDLLELLLDLVDAGDVGVSHPPCPFACIAHVECATADASEEAVPAEVQDQSHQATGRQKHEERLSRVWRARTTLPIVLHALPLQERDQPRVWAGRRGAPRFGRARGARVLRGRGDDPTLSDHDRGDVPPIDMLLELAVRDLFLFHPAGREDGGEGGGGKRPPARAVGHRPAR